MSRNDWRGDSQPVAQRRRFTIGGTPAAGNTVSVVVNRKSATYTVLAGDTVALVAAGLAAAWDGASFPEKAEANTDYTAANAYLDLVAATAGVPFTATAAATGGGATNTATDVTASAGPNHADDPNNWTLGTVPAGTDSVVVNGGASLLWGLGSITCAAWEFRPGFQNEVGLPPYNATGYAEYRTPELTINAPTVVVDCPSSRLFLKAVAGSSWLVRSTGTRGDASTPALDIGATGNPAAVSVAGGDVGFLTRDESAARTVTAASLTGDGSVLTTGRTSTVTALDMDRGTAVALGTVSALTMGRGSYTQAEGALTAFTAYGGTIYLNHAGSTTPTCRGTGGGELGPVVDCSANNLARTFPNSEFVGGAYLLDENKSVTLTGGGTHTADATFFAHSLLGPLVTWNRT